jgi:hypothetical protein
MLGVCVGFEGRALGASVGAVGVAVVGTRDGPTLGEPVVGLREVGLAVGA